MTANRYIGRDMAGAQAQMLLTLGTGALCNVTALARRIGARRATLTAALMALVRDGYAGRALVGNSARFSLTDKGRARLASLYDNRLPPEW